MWLDGKSPINRPAQMGKSALHEAMFAPLHPRVQQEVKELIRTKCEVSQ